MFQYEELKEGIKEGDIIQVITTDFNGGLAKLVALHQSYIHLGPLDKGQIKDADEIGSVSQEILIPLNCITVLLKIDLQALKETQNNE